MKYFLVIIAFLTTFHLFAQEGEEKELLVVYKQQNGPASDIIDRMLEVVNVDAENIDRSYVIKFIERPTYKERENDVQAFLHLENFRIEGLKSYLDFSFEEDFKPSSVNIQVGIFVEQQRQRNLIIKKIPINNGQIKPIELLLETNQTVKVTAIDALVSVEQYYHLKSKIDLINGYVNSFYQLEEIAGSIAELSSLLGNPRQIKLAQDQLRIIESDFKRISLLGFWTKLDYKKSEATTGYNIDGLMNDVRNYLIDNARQVEYNANNLYFGYQQLGLELYQKGKVEKARKNFEAAIEEKPDFPQANYMLALIAYQEKDYETAITKTQFLLDPRYVNHEESIEKSKELAQLLFNDLFELGKNAFEGKNKEKALPYFQQAESFCINTIGVLCDLTELEEWIAKCK